jgi:hypothetical protein
LSYSSPYVPNFLSWVSSVGTVTGQQVELPVEWTRACSKVSRRALGPTQSPVQWVPGMKRLRREADHESDLEINNTFCQPYAVVAPSEIKQWDNFELLHTF